MQDSFLKHRDGDFALGQPQFEIVADVQGSQASGGSVTTGESECRVAEALRSVPANIVSHRLPVFEFDHDTGNGWFLRKRDETARARVVDIAEGLQRLAGRKRIDDRERVRTGGTVFDKPRARGGCNVRQCSENILGYSRGIIPLARLSHIPLNACSPGVPLSSDPNDGPHEHV